MTRHQNIRDQANQANEHAIQGGIDGGIRWFLAGVIVFGTAQLVWPPYRKLTPQFKVPPLPPPCPLLAGETIWAAADGRRFCYLLVCGGVEVETDCSYCGGGGDKCGEEVSPLC
jgi:hypothetical protein